MEQYCIALYVVFNDMSIVKATLGSRSTDTAQREQALRSSANVMDFSDAIKFRTLPIAINSKRLFYLK